MSWRNAADDPPVGKCTKCGRSTWDKSSIGSVDHMPQPSGVTCGGTFVQNLDWGAPRAKSQSSVPAEPFAIDAAHLTRQREFSLATFGPGVREAGVIDHIRKELVEIADAETLEQAVQEWVDVIILALDGALRTGVPAQEVLDAVLAKQQHNEAREWPNWRTQPKDRAIEHVRTREGA
ncbi:DUF550 domain-containing protein [Demequina sp. TTPB684]|uniref:dATP/dGTP pyrophosphohydrolase domain-containing protein n=1 Tax=unclassified Demequina TaxID=2620311 RepID=UPI001CF3B34C|nr:MULTISPECIES: dATP/dGTP pyrophosphohydrolase domain-containing protein [unclassified Demequina]MCB2412368.1 DUF550 domain-containing protein [Demequina sp. TTPB684]UPU89038.1 DUF550 domain-containing protein [Demequina sp. TMPB413]